MTDYDALVERHILEHEARQKHFDELLVQAEQGVGSSSEAAELNEELVSLRSERDKLLAHIEQLKQKTHEEWQEETIEEAGPMIMWEAIAKRLAALVERIGR